MFITAENYYSPEADKYYLSVNYPTAKAVGLKPHVDQAKV